MGTIEVASARSNNQTDVLDLAEYSNVEGFMHKIFYKDKSSDPRLASTFATLLEIDETTNLIESASQAISALSSRCEILEAELMQEKSDRSEQESHIEGLRKMVLEFRAKHSAMEADTKALTHRCQAAEARVAELEQAQKVATLRATKAENLSNKLQQQVEAAFGRGSPIRSVMESVKLQQAAE